MTTLFSATQALAEILMEVRNGTATATGAAGKTTLIDTTRLEPDNTYQKDAFRAGTIWFTSGSNNGISRSITNYVQTTGTFTFAAVTAQTVANDTYVVAPIQFPRDVLIRGINSALRRLPGPIKDDGIISSTKNQMDYDLLFITSRPSHDVKRVEIASYTAHPYDYVKHHNWRIVNSQLSFHELAQVPYDSHRIRITYQPENSAISADTNEIPQHIPLERLIWEAAVDIYRPISAKGEEEALKYGEILETRKEAALMYSIPILRKDPIHNVWAI